MESNNTYLTTILGAKDRVILGFFIALWIVGQILFWDWWLDPDHIVDMWRMTINSILLAWTFVMPAYFFFFVWRMKKPVTLTEDELNNKKWRVAMVTTKTPAEPFEVIKKTLIAMLEQKHPHDVWLGDEDPETETIRWCEKHGVNIYTRKGIAEYNNDTWPRRKKCKEGNLSFFYDKFGYDNYDIVVQLDSDHVPQKGYLEAILSPFADSKVGYVSAPSICNANADNSWSARGRLHAEATLHGPLQAGYTNGFVPLCIGSHYAVRTKALREVGGIGPELAEDHSTSLLMQAGGWKGAHAIDAIAHGDGPNTFADCMKQEFQWSRSLTILLVAWTPKYWKNLRLAAKLEFLFAQLWYPIFSLSMFFGSLLSVYALISGIPWMRVSYVWFLLFSLSFSLIAIGVVYTLKRKKLLRPVDAPVVSWELVVYQIVRWPWELVGVVTGLVDGILGKNFPIKVTPKGDDNERPLPIKVLSPYLLLSLIYIAAIFLIRDPGNSQGYYYFAMLGLASYVGALWVIIRNHFKENPSAAKIAKKKDLYETS